MYFLGHNQDIQERLLDEINNIIGDNDPNFDNIKNLSLCHNIIKESLRLKPVVPNFTRIAPTKQILNGYVIAANVIYILFNI